MELRLHWSYSSSSTTTALSVATYGGLSTPTLLSLLLTVLSVFAGRRFHMHYCAFLSLFPSLCKGGDLGTAMHVMRAVTQ